MSEMGIYHFEDVDWHVPTSAGTDPQAAADAGRRGARRRFLAQGDNGFYSQIVDLPPDFDTPAHSHDHAEVFVVLEGSCTFNGDTLQPYDTAVIPAHGVYGFKTGPAGLRFLVVRTAQAAFAAAPA